MEPDETQAPCPASSRGGNLEYDRDEKDYVETVADFPWLDNAVFDIAGVRARHRVRDTFGSRDCTQQGNESFGNAVGDCQSDDPDTGDCTNDYRSAERGWNIGIAT